MSHSKMTKRGRSRYVESDNPDAKRFINTCVLCGKQGYRPSIADAGFTGDSSALRNKNFVHSAIYAELSRMMEPLALDGLGRCEACAAVMDGNKTKGSNEDEL